MKTKTVRAAVAAALLATAGAAHAVTIVSGIGDQDGFGLGVSSGAGFDFDAIGGGDGDGTDVWRGGNLAFTLSYALPQQVSVASLELFSGGWGLDMPPSLYLNGTFVGLLSDGDDVGPLYNYAFKDTVDLTSYASLLTGHDVFEIRLAAGDDDSGALDYAQLTVTGNIATSVPEPETYALLAMGILSLVAARRRSKTVGAPARRSP